MEAVNVLVSVAVTVAVVTSTDAVVGNGDLRHTKTVFLVVCDPSMNKLLAT
jgi:hypothetical protein